VKKNTVKKKKGMRKSLLDEALLNNHTEIGSDVLGKFIAKKQIAEGRKLI